MNWQLLRKGLLYITLPLLLQAVCPGKAAAQQKEVQHEEEIWFGYMSTARVSDRFSVWNDFHYIPAKFTVIRTGLTYHFANRIDATAGYAHIWLPWAGEMKRREHRPWGQIVLPATLGNNLSLQSRIRWDLRYRQRVTGTEIGEGYTFHHRGRVQAVLRRSFPQLTFYGLTPSLALADELLMNLGREVINNHFDQNRLSLMAALRYKGLMLQAGYMNRYVQSATPGRYTSNHSLVFWLFHSIDFRRHEPLPPTASE